jgi:hypothetical protein
VHILEILFRLFGMTFGTVHIHKTFSKVDIGVGMNMTVYTCEPSHFVDILSPILGIHIKRADNTIL